MLKKFWLKATAALLGVSLLTATAAAFPPVKLVKPMPIKPVPSKPMPGKPMPVKPLAGKPVFPKHLHPSVQKMAVYKGHHFSHQGHHHHFRCVTYWSVQYGCWFYWSPQFGCYLPVTYVYEYPPVEEIVPPMDPDY